MKKCILIICLALAAPALFSFDFGLTIENTTGVITTENNQFLQKDKASLWTLFDLSDTASINIEGFYSFRLQDPYHAYSLDRLELAMDFPVIGEHSFLFGFALGRLRAADFTGYIVSHPVDGARLVYRNAFMNVELAGGYTGLIFKGESTLSMSIEDQNYAPPYIALVPPRLVGVLNLNFPEALAYQTLDFTVVGNLDLHDESTVIQPGVVMLPDFNNGGKFSSLYAGVGLNGPLFENFYWELFGIFEYGQTLSYLYSDGAYFYEPLLAFIAGFKLDWYFPDFWKSKLSLDVIVSSGDGDYENYLEGNTDSYSLQFVPVTRPTIGLVFAQQLTNLIVARLEYSFKPFTSDKKDLGDKLQMALSILTYFRAAKSDVSDSRGLNSGSDDYYLGNEIDLITGFKPLSDLGLELALGLFLPNNYTATSAFSPTGRGIEFLARFTLVLEI